MPVFLFAAKDPEILAEEWLRLAVDEDRKGLDVIHTNVACDGFRMHIALDIKKNCECDARHLHTSLNAVIDMGRKASFSFSINRTLLLEALAGINPDEGYINFFVSGPEDPVVIQEPEAVRTAIIMPLKKPVHEPNPRIDKLPVEPDEEKTP